MTCENCFNPIICNLIVQKRTITNILESDKIIKKYPSGANVSHPVKFSGSPRLKSWAALSLLVRIPTSKLINSINLFVGRDTNKGVGRIR